MVAPTRGSQRNVHGFFVATGVAELSADDSTFRETLGLMIETTGDVAVVMSDGSTAILTLTGGQIYPLAVTSILTTGTGSVGDIWGFY